MRMSLKDALKSAHKLPVKTAEGTIVMVSVAGNASGVTTADILPLLDALEPSAPVSASHKGSAPELTAAIAAEDGEENAPRGKSSYSFPASAVRDTIRDMLGITETAPEQSRKSRKPRAETTPVNGQPVVN